MSMPGYFDALYENPDPFHYRSRWYEARKRAVTLACLPHHRYANAWELGCSNGVLTAELAGRCDALLGTDVSADALTQAAASTAAWPQVTLQRAHHPEEWPAGKFDLIVVSEVGYYLDPRSLALLARRLHQSLTDGGILVACHWHHAFAAASSSTLEVHQALQGQLIEAFHYQDEDFVLQGWSADPISVAEWEGLR